MAVTAAPGRTPPVVLCTAPVRGCATSTTALPKPQLVATYDYPDLDGVVVAQKMRMQPKGFRWQHPEAVSIWGREHLR
jgi:hypothetical protein